MLQAVGTDECGVSDFVGESLVPCVDHFLPFVPRALGPVSPFVRR